MQSDLQSKAKVLECLPCVCRLKVTEVRRNRQVNRNKAGIYDPKFRFKRIKSDICRHDGVEGHAECTRISYVRCAVSNASTSVTSSHAALIRRTVWLLCWRGSQCSPLLNLRQIDEFSFLGL